jgi:hypothetical protein
MRLHFLLVLALSLSLTGEQGSHTLFTGQREPKRERERETETETETERERGREREREMFRIVILIFKRNDGCLGTF